MPGTVVAQIGLWSHAFAAVAFGGLALWQLIRARTSLQQTVLAGAYGATGCWAMMIAAEGPETPIALFAENVRNLAWLAFMMMLLRRGAGDRRRHFAVLSIYGVLALVLGAQTAMDLLPRFFEGSPRIVETFFFAGMMMRLMVAIGALVLVHNLYTAAAPEARWGIRLPMIALAAMWAYDLNYYTLAWLTHDRSVDLAAMRGVIMLLLAPLFLMASRRNDRWKLQLSRTVAFQSLSLMAIGGYLIAMVIVTRAVELIGGDYTRMAQVTILFGMAVTALLLFPSGRMRAWLRVKIAKHFFQHRYDYRTEWLRFTDTLGQPGDDSAPLDQRVIKAIADIAESPGGVLLRVEAGQGLAAVTRWNWRTVEPPAQAAGLELIAHLQQTGRILDCDALRADPAAEEARLLPEWIHADPRAWAAVPLIHFDRLAGVVLLERPRIDRKLDWEDFDLLRVAGRQAASYLAEARGQEALSEAQRFDEFNRRFAFIMHDIKNLVSQLSLLARNAERHADNPAFRADMIATLNNSAGKMTDMLARLSRHGRGRVEEPRPVAIGSIVEGVAAAKRAQRPILTDSRTDIVALADPARLEQALGHIVQNAIDASAAGEPVAISIERRLTEVELAVVDHGAGMSAEFIRSRLFRPFASTKEGGFGIGAYEARSLVIAMGGRLEVESREGEGSRFLIILPLPVPGTEAARMRA